MIIVTYDDFLKPEKATLDALCYDLKAAENIIIGPKEIKIVKLGIKTDFAWFLFARSSLILKKGLLIGNGVGVIDADYRDEVGMILYNIKDEDVVINYGDRIGQMYIPNGNPKIIVNRELYDNWGNIKKSERKGGFGSTNGYIQNI